MASERVTLDTVAAAAGVSRMTVSNAYNRPDQLSAATRTRVMEVAAELGYSGPDPTAASLRLRRTRTVGVVLTERLPYAFADPGMVTILHGLASGLSEAGYALLLVPESGVDDEPLVRQALVDALVLCALPDGHPAVAAALERQVPVVTVGNPRLPHVPRLGTDNRAATALVARHLLDLGHRSFAVLTAESSGQHTLARPGFAERTDWFTAALHDAGIGSDRVTVHTATENARGAGAAALSEPLAARRARPTAVFAVTDILALGALDAASRAGLAVPADLSVVGFDNVAPAALSDPPLTTVEHDLFGQGQAAARLALRMIAGESVRAPRMAPRLVVRGSTAAAR